MKKLHIFLAAGVALAMSSCTEDFTAEGTPQSNAQENILQTSDVIVTPSASQAVTYDATATITLGSITVKEGMMPSNSYVQSPEVQVSTTEDFAKYQKVTPQSMAENNSVIISVSDLQSAIYDKGLYIDNDPVTLYFRTIVQVVTNSTSIANVGGAASYYELGEVVYTPQQHEVLPEYYMVGNINEWKYDQNYSALFPTSLKTFTYSTYFNGSWDCKICKLASGKLNEYYFAAKDNDGTCTDLTMDNATGGCITAPAAGYYTINIDLNTNTYSWTPITNPTDYTTPGIGIIGANNDWSNDLVMTQVTTQSGNPSHVWYYKNMVITDKAWGIQFRTVGSWADQWGNSNPTVDRTCTYATCNGKNNTPVELGTYDVYFNDITKQFLIIKKD